MKGDWLHTEMVCSHTDGHPSKWVSVSRAGVYRSGYGAGAAGRRNKFYSHVTPENCCFRVTCPDATTAALLSWRLLGLLTVCLRSPAIIESLDPATEYGHPATFRTSGYLLPFKFYIILAPIASETAIIRIIYSSRIALRKEARQLYHPFR